MKAHTRIPRTRGAWYGSVYWDEPARARTLGWNTLFTSEYVNNFLGVRVCRGAK